MSRVRGLPCAACPYRRDVPSGLWAHEEYEKLRGYDLPTGEQPMMVFACHSTPENLCHGWACREPAPGHELIALRFPGVLDGPVPEAAVPLFATGEEAAEHGQRDIAEPSPEAQERIERLRRYPRLADQ